ncbi:protein phosphatase 2C domain-containing protein [Streptomyces sp. LE64]|uniref:protein phosphatase 2C domain-containing protein n=1 Tax=Streptomyces sp. LE64 TaxID=3448653 RepID=UPI0040427E26
MSQQGERTSARPEDDWWGDLYAGWPQVARVPAQPSARAEGAQDLEHTAPAEAGAKAPEPAGAAPSATPGRSAAGPVEPPAPVTPGAPPPSRPAAPATAPRPPWQPGGAVSEPRTFRLGRFGRRSTGGGEGDDPVVVALPPPVEHLGDRSPAHEGEPTALPAADPDALAELVPDTVLDGARYGTGTLRTVSTRGDAARHGGGTRRDALLTARFGTGDDALVLVAVATGAGPAGTHRAAAEHIAGAVGRSHERLAADLRASRRGELKSGLHRLTDRSLGTLRAGLPGAATEAAADALSLRCLLLPADPACRVRVFFGVGDGGLFRLREGAWQDIEPRVTDTAGEPVVGFGSPPGDADRAPAGPRSVTPPGPLDPEPFGAPRAPFRFRASVARPGDALLLCSEGLAVPLRAEQALAAHLAGRWADGPPGLAAFLADATVRVTGYAEDRTAAVVWEA